MILGFDMHDMQEIIYSDKLSDELPAMFHYITWILFVNCFLCINKYLNADIHFYTYTFTISQVPSLMQQLVRSDQKRIPCIIIYFSLVVAKRRRN